jgi:hypothetical protein
MFLRPDRPLRAVLRRARPLAPCLAAALGLAALSLTRTAVAESRIELAPGILVTARAYAVPDNEAPFFNFADKDFHRKAIDAAFVADVLNAIPDRSAAADAVAQSGWRALADGDAAAAARRFNQAMLLDPRRSPIYHGFAMVAARRFLDHDYADELFRLAAGLEGPLPTLAGDHGRLLVIAGRPQAAKPLLDKAVAHTIGWAEQRAHLAWAAMASGNPARACQIAAQIAGREFATLASDLALLRRKAKCLS